MHEKKNVVLDTAEKVEGVVEEVAHITDRKISPFRHKAVRRFPITFTLLVTSGVALTFFGFERLVSEVAWLYERPVVILLLGIAILALTGTLYKKLG